MAGGFRPCFCHSRKNDTIALVFIRYFPCVCQVPQLLSSSSPVVVPPHTFLSPFPFWPLVRVFKFTFNISLGCRQQNLVKYIKGIRTENFQLCEEIFPLLYCSNMGRSTSKLFTKVNECTHCANNTNIIRIPKNDRIRIPILFDYPKLTEYEYEYYLGF